MDRKVLTIFAVLVALSVVTSGCVVLVAGGAAAGAGAYAWVNGKLTFTSVNSIRECHDATLSAFNDLVIEVTSDSADPLSGRIKGTTGTGDAVTVDLEPQASDVTRIEVRVGFWGSRSKSVRIADAIRRHLQ